MLDASVRDALRTIIDKRGPDASSNANLIKALLSDLCPTSRAERNMLVQAALVNIPADMLDARSVPWPLLRTRMIGILRRDHGIEEANAAWVVDAWGYALRISPEAASEPDPLQTTPPAPQDSPKPVIPKPASVRGDDVMSALSLIWEEAKAGCNKTILVNGKNVKITVPANSQTTPQLTIVGEGKPGQNGGANGNLIVRLTVSPEQKATVPASRPITPPTPRWQNGVVLSALLLTIILGAVWFQKQTHTGSGNPPGNAANTSSNPPANIAPQTITSQNQHGLEQLQSQYGMEMALIPGGPFLMGDADQSDNPPHTVTLSPYYIAKNVVTVKQYLAFCAATGHLKPKAPSFNANWSKEDHPIVNVSWNDAKAYCDWLSKKTGLAVTLPTEAQWEKAARGTDGRKFPWGNTFDSNKLWSSVGGAKSGTTPVGSYIDSPYGLSDMAGNVWQWCSDWYDKDYCKSDHGSDPTGPATGTDRALRGGSWGGNLAAFFRCAYRDWLAPDSRYSVGGFRCVARADTH